MKTALTFLLLGAVAIAYCFLRPGSTPVENTEAVEAPAVAIEPSAERSFSKPTVQAVTVAFDPKQLISAENVISTQPQFQLQPTNPEPQAPLLADGGYLSPEDYDAQMAAIKAAKAKQPTFATIDPAALEAQLVQQSRIAQPTIQFQAKPSTGIDLQTLSPNTLLPPQFAPNTTTE